MSPNEVPAVQSPKNATRSLRDYDADDFTGPNFVDHFSLRDPSSTVKFRGTRVHVYNTTDEQYILEDRRSSRDTESADASGDFDDNGKNRQHRHTITVKRLPYTSFGLRLLRLAYTLIALLIFGYAFAFCFQIILFLFVNLATDARPTSDSDLDDAPVNVAAETISTLLSIPIFLFGLSSLMAIATTFVTEAWSGGYLIRSVFGVPAILAEAVYFVFFLLIPTITFLSALFARVENPWEITCYAWLGCVAFVFISFALGITWWEVSSCFQLLSIHYVEDDSEELSSFVKTLRKVHRAILLSQTQIFSGYKREQYLVTDKDVAPKGGYTFSDEHNPISVQRSLRTRILQLGCLCCMYDSIDPPTRIYSIEEVRDILPFITKHNFSLEAMFCSNSRSRTILSAKGPSAVAREQIISSLSCNIIGTLLITLSCISFLVWMNTKFRTYILVGVLILVCMLVPLIRSQRRVIEMFSDVNKDDLIEEGDEQVEVEDETTLFSLWETSRVVQPKVWVCYAGMLLQFSFLFAWPISTLFTTGNNLIGVTFFIISVLSFLIKYLNASVVLCELGSMSSIDIERTPKDDERTLQSKARLAEIAGKVSKSKDVTRWMWFFGALVLFTCYLFLGAISSDDGLGERPPIILVDDYAYPGETSLQYPTCAMAKGFRFSADGVDRDAALGDFAFLSALAYETTDVTSFVLPQWFTETEVVDEDTKVKEYREGVKDAAVPVYFKLFTFPAVPDIAVISIRGSQTTWDWMVNMQLWSSSGLAQIVKWLTPFGWIWTPILDDLVWFLSLIQSEKLSEIDYYRVTTAATKHFRQSHKKLRVTGASLGGGLAIITGAQAKTPSVAISGLGVEFSRNAVNPPVTMDDINKYVFNFIPDRDYIARVGGRPRQHQEAHCTASNSNFFGCHSMWRSVCEINYRCGSNGRPVICRCHYQFDYPEPEPIGDTTRTFKEACQEQEQAFLDGTGSTKQAGWLIEL
mmetsp:Transcript_14453/g.40241  ORF Transcript_14453/g.40241 Transcript_14453/m.40241 type:complete len:977 (+) Transcript_14453:144-3074(+)